MIMLKKATLIVLLLLIRCLAFADVFVVTSNADSGPGTLREALTKAAANGNTSKDYINFNLPDLSIVGRTITLTTQLPGVSSNLVIDGTTQPGAVFGKSDAKIVLQPNSQSTKDNVPFNLTNVDAFEVYGLYVRDFIGEFPFNGTTVFFVKTSKNIKIGAPGKGNVFANNGYVFSTIYGKYYGNVVPPYFDGVENLTVCSNFFGFEPDGKSFRGNSQAFNPVIDLSNCAGNIIIGGDSETERNIFGNAGMPISCTTTQQASNHPTTFTIKNNFFSYDIDGQPAKLPNLNTSTLYTIRITDGAPYSPSLLLPYKIYILNNKIQVPCGIAVGMTTEEIICQGNVVDNYDYPNKPSYAMGGLALQSKERILIGGENPGEANILYGTRIYSLSRKSVLIQRNSIFCFNEDDVWRPAVPYMDPPLPLPVVSINSITLNSVIGTASPSSKVELFWDDDCRYCQPLNYAATVNADANGNWQYNGPIQKGVIASASLNGFTSLFTSAPIINPAFTNVIKVTHSSCSQGGSVTGITFKNAGGIQWKDQTGVIIGNAADISNLGTGTYTVTLLNGTCSIDYIFKIYDATPIINDGNKRVTNPSCSGKGAITGLYVSNSDVLQESYSRGDYNPYTFKWKDAAGNTISSSIDLTDVNAGSYTLEVSYKGQCPKIYGPLVLRNTTGPDLDQTNAIIQSTNCGQTAGSVTGIIATGTGTLNYTWKNSAQQIVATTADLTNQAAGQYRLTVTDDSACGSVLSNIYIIPQTNGISLNDAGVAITPSSCNTDNGSVKGIIVTGATTYKWVNAGNITVATTVDLLNAAAGTYTFNASNSFGCLQSKSFTVGAQTVTQYPAYAETISPSCSGTQTGSITITADNKVISMRWLNGQNVNLGTGSSLANLSAGAYRLYVTDVNGCETLYKTFTVTEIPPIKITTSSAVITDDLCGTKMGNVRNVQVTGGSGSYNYEWTDSNNAVIGTTADIDNLAQGTYKLRVYNANSCTQDVATYTVFNETTQPAAPFVNNIETCSSGDVIIAIANPQTGYQYKLYQTALSTSPIAVQPNGKFKVNVKSSGDYYISTSLGTCESPRAKMSVTLSVSTLAIPNTFTPNGDGINDLWLIPGLSFNTTARVQLFNRSGAKVFESKGYTTPFDGRLNGQALPLGTYYYVINPGQGCKIFSGTVTLIR